MTDHGLFDIHCHLIPGVDDGAQDLEETRRLLRMEYEQGVRNIIATPHYRDQMFDTPIHTIRSQFALVEKCVQEFNQELAKEDRMRIYLGCEFHANMQMSRMLDEGRVSTMADSGYVLVEFSGNAEYSYIEDRLRSLIIVGYRPIIAHVERCDNIWGDKVALTDGKLTVVSENIANEEAAELLAALCNGSTAVVTQMKKERKKSFPPKLYNLTSLQREANRYFGYTAKRTLDMLQELYEEKLVTYPRTDSQFVTEDMKDSVEELVEKMPVLLSFVDYGQLGHGIKRVINNAKVSDHHAILPTKEVVEKGIADLPADKKNLMMLICQQLVQATGEEYLYEQTDITVKCQEHDFKARGKIPVQMGFKEVEKAFKQLCVKAEPVEEKEKETSIPAGYEEGMRLFPVKAEKTTHYTSPPKPFNEDTLLAAMETAGNKEFDSETEKKGLGTPATRASIIEKLVSSGYAQRKGKQILPSTEGKELVKVMPEYLKSAVMTAEWENQLLMMEKGQITDTQFMGEITSLVRKILEVCREIPEEERRRFQTAREVIGKCPVCGCDVFEGKQNFYCSNRQCDFALWKENRFLGSMEKNLDKKMARELLDKACTHVKGLYSKKKDMKFDADLLLTLEDGKPRFHLEFPKKKKK